MKQIGGVLNILFGLLAILFGYTGLSDYFGGTEKKIEKYTQLLNEGETTLAVLDSTYTEVTIKGATVNYVDYTFQIDNETYKGEYYFDDINSITSPLMEVKYLKSDPEINAVDAEERLNEAKESAESSFDLILGIVASLFGLLLIYSGIRRFKTQKTQE
ncbi:MAG: hypothetical protein MI974_25545 [Chitinophagales bacterium]|nr:hypothetical protein [Chitinophagales bacterium]